jgi:hypothetical protein
MHKTCQRCEYNAQWDVCPGMAGIMAGLHAAQKTHIDTGEFSL